YDEFDDRTDQRLGDYYIEAEGRLTNDLLNGKPFTEYKRFVKNKGIEIGYERKVFGRIYSMKEDNMAGLPHITNEIVGDAHGHLLDAYAISLEGWRRGLTLRWHIKDSEKFSEMETWFVDRPGQLFSLSAEQKTHYFFRTRGDKVTNEAVRIGKDKEKTKKLIK